MNDAILLQSGEFYSFTSPEKNKFTVEDIAEALSNICRFGGHVSNHYSVAQHAVNVSYDIEPEYALDGLLHDGVEAFLCDIPTPLKALLKDYQALEEKHEKELFKRFGLQYPMVDAVKRADKRAFCTEVRDMKPKNAHWDSYCGITTYDYKIIPWSHEKAKRKFLERYYEITKKEC